MQLYKPNTRRLNIKGVDYVADSNGIIEVPDSEMHDGVWSQGFTVATGRLRELAEQAEREAKAEASANAAVIVQAAPKASKVTESTKQEN